MDFMRLAPAFGLLAIPGCAMPTHDPEAKLIVLVRPFVMAALTMMVTGDVSRPRTVMAMPGRAAVDVVYRRREAWVGFLLPLRAALRACRAMLAGLVVPEPDALFDQAGGDIGHIHPASSD